MVVTRYLPVVLLVIAASAPDARAGIAFLTQSRSVFAATSVDNNAQTTVAPDFAPFVTVLTLSANFATPVGPATNLAQAGIDCQIDPNGVQLLGSLAAAGGLDINGAIVTGETAANILITFVVDTATPFSIIAGPRGTVPGDRFKIKLEPLVGAALLFIDDSMPPQSVNFNSVLAPGEYTLQYEIELTADGALTTHNFNMGFSIPAPGALALLPFGALAAARRRRA